MGRVAALEESSRVWSLRGGTRLAVDRCALRLRVRKSNLVMDNVIIEQCFSKCGDP